MQTALLLGFEMGTHEIPFHFDTPLCWIFLLGAGIQFLLLRPKRKKLTRWVLAIILLCGLLACEIGCLVLTGWDTLAPIILYFYLAAMLLGAGICALAVWLKQRRMA